MLCKKNGNPCDQKYYKNSGTCLHPDIEWARKECYGKLEACYRCWPTYEPDCWNCRQLNKRALDLLGGE